MEQFDINKRIDEVAIQYFKGNNSLFASELNTSEANIRNYRKDTIPKIDFIKKLRDKLEISYDELLEGKKKQVSAIVSEEMEGYKIISKGIPLVNVTAIGGFGNNNFSIETQDVKEYYIIPKFKNKKIDFMIEVEGSSMYPKYNSGDIVACTIINENSFIQWNKTHVIATKDQGIIIKRIKKCDDENTLCMVSDNASYDPFEVPKDEIKGIALVVGVIRLE